MDNSDRDVMQSGHTLGVVIQTQEKVTIFKEVLRRLGVQSLHCALQPAGPAPEEAFKTSDFEHWKGLQPREPRPVGNWASVLKGKNSLALSFSAESAV